MTSRELVLRTLEFESPGPIPRDLWVLPWADAHYPEELKIIRETYPSDIVTAPPAYPNARKTDYDESPFYLEGEYADPWGSVFVNMQPGVIGEVKDPPVKDWNDLSKVRLPNQFLSLDVDQINAFCKSTDKFVMGPFLGIADMPRPFERLQFLRGTAELYMDLIDQPDAFRTFFKQLHEYYIKAMENWARTDVDGMMFMDDWGSQKTLLISPDMWRELFKPMYKDYIDIAHQYGKKAFMHSDGNITEIYPDLAELGLDAVNSQLFCMDFEKLGELYRGKITFWGEMDRQYLLAYAEVEEVKEAVKKLHDALYENGGIIAQCEFSAGSKPENVTAVFETFNELGGN